MPKIKGAAKGQLVGLEDVGPKGFIEFVEDWVQNFKEYLKKFKNIDVLIQTKTVKSNLRGSIKYRKFPVSTEFYNKIEAQLNTLDKKASPKAIAEAISTGLDNFDANLKKVYKADKADYRAIKKKDLEDNILKPKDFYTWMQGVIKEEGESVHVEKTIRTWLEGEKSNLEKMQFAEGMLLDCDSFRMSLTLSVGQKLQALICKKVPSEEFKASDVQQIIVNNIDAYLKEKTLNQVFLNNADFIGGFSNNHIQLAAEGNFKVNSEFLGNLMEQGFYLVAKTIIDITLEGSSDDSYIDVESLRLNSSPFCKEHLLKTSEKWMSLSDFSKMIEQCKTSCLKNPSKYSKYIEGNSSFGLDSFVQLIKKNHHKQPEGNTKD